MSKCLLFLYSYIHNNMSSCSLQDIFNLISPLLHSCTVHMTFHFAGDKFAYFCEAVFSFICIFLCSRIPVNSLLWDIHYLILQWVLRKIHKGRISRRIFAHDRNQGIYEYRWGFLNALLYYVSTHNYPLYEVFLYTMYGNVQKCSLKKKQ